MYWNLKRPKNPLSWRSNKISSCGDSTVAHSSGRQVGQRNESNSKQEMRFYKRSLLPFSSSTKGVQKSCSKLGRDLRTGASVDQLSSFGCLRWSGSLVQFHISDGHPPEMLCDGQAVTHILSLSEFLGDGCVGVIEAELSTRTGHMGVIFNYLFWINSRSEKKVQLRQYFELH